MDFLYECLQNVSFINKPLVIKFNFIVTEVDLFLKGSGIGDGKTIVFFKCNLKLRWAYLNTVAKTRVLIKHPKLPKYENKNTQNCKIK